MPCGMAEPLCKVELVGGGPHDGLRLETPEVTKWLLLRPNAQDDELVIWVTETMLTPAHVERALLRLECEKAALYSVSAGDGVAWSEGMVEIEGD